MHKMLISVPEDDGPAEAADYHVFDAMEIGDGRFQTTIDRYPVGADGHIGIVRTKAFEDLMVDASIEGNIPLVSNSFIGHGKLRFQLGDNKIVITPRNGYSTVAINAKGCYDFRKGDDWSSISSVLSVPMLEQKLDGLIPADIKKAISLCEKTEQLISVPNTPEMISIVTLALNADIKDAGLRRIYYEGVVTQLLVQRAITMSDDASCPSVPSITKRDRDAVNDARSFLLSDLQQPPALFEIAQKFGLSERRLIDCMRIEFGQTPAEMLRSARLEHSVELLREGKMQIKEIAYMAGYSHAANFTNAFKKRYGLPPQQYITQSRR